MEEIFRDIEGYEGLYQVSNYGNVYSLRSKKLMAQTQIGPRKIKMVHFSVNGKGSKSIQVHRLVAMAFQDICGEYFEGAQVNHKDENPWNNNATNLEWCTPKYNSSYGTRGKRIGENNSKPVQQLTMYGDVIAEYASAKEAAAAIGVENYGHIGAVCNGVKYRYTAYGYKWRWK